MLEITINISENLTNAINNLAAAIGGCEFARTTVGGPSEVDVKAPTADTTPPVAGMPSFATEDAKREWLVEQLTKLGVEIPPRTRTTTLEKKWQELAGKEPETTNPSQSGGENGSGDSSTPSEDTPNTIEEDLFGEEKTYTKAEVTSTLKAYVTGASDEKDRVSRREKVRAKLTECGAKSVTDLDSKHYAAMVDTFKE